MPAAPAIPDVQPTLLRFCYIYALAGASGKVMYVYETYVGSTPAPPAATGYNWTINQNPTAPVGSSYTAGSYSPSS